jgi:hypothetical protein
LDSEDVEAIAFLREYKEISWSPDLPEFLKNIFNNLLPFWVASDYQRAFTLF